jgi:hypothetical protein
MDCPIAGTALISLTGLRPFTGVFHDAGARSPSRMHDVVSQSFPFASHLRTLTERVELAGGFRTPIPFSSQDVVLRAG